MKGITDKVEVKKAERNLFCDSHGGHSCKTSSMSLLIYLMLLLFFIVGHPKIKIKINFIGEKKVHKICVPFMINKFFWMDFIFVQWWIYFL